MRWIAIGIEIIALSIASAMAGEARILHGRIIGYECGDNCYLLIRGSNRKEYRGLCAAPECQQWNEQAQMPKSFIGKTVKVTIGLGNQYDADGNIMGRMDAFIKIKFK